jgi:hypothetical protein
MAKGFGHGLGMDARPISLPGGGGSLRSRRPAPTIETTTWAIAAVRDREGVHMRHLSWIAILCLGASASIAAGAVSSGGSGGGHSSGGNAGDSAASSGAGGSHSGAIGVRGGDGPHAQRTAAGAGRAAAQTKLSADLKGATVTHATVEGKPVQLATLKCPPLSNHAKKVLLSHGWIEYFPVQNQPYYCHDRDRSDPRFGERDCFRIVN